MKHNGFEYIDLGLPSGTKWATCNVGADSETDCGLYFSWGETKGYSVNANTKKFSLNDYKFSKFGSNKPTKYNCTDGKKVLDLEDDAAQANMGGKWHMPTREEIIELRSNTIKNWVTNYNGSGINGCLVISKKDYNKKLFFPAYGHIDNCHSLSLGSRINFWSNSISCFGGYYYSTFCSFKSCIMSVFGDYRFIGMNVRGVFNTFWMK